MQKIKDLRNHAKGIGVKITYMTNDGKRKYYTKKQLLEKIKNAIQNVKGGSFWSDFKHGFKEGFDGVAELAKPIVELAGGDMKKSSKKSSKRTKGGKLIGLALPPQYQKKMTAGALHDKHKRVQELLKKIENRVMKPYLEKFYQ